MNINEKLGMIFDSLAKELNITQTMLDKAVTSYSALGEHIKKNNEEWEVSVYPQGSFALGTVIKPLNSQEQYDVDLIVLVNRPEFSAEDLRVNIKELLESHGRYDGKIEDKKPCIRIQYADSAQFHMDIASAKTGYRNDDNFIEISRIDEDHNFYYDPSNPKGYIEWFKKVMNYETILLEKRAFTAEADTNIEKIELTKLQTPLQKSIQILKRHRDIYFTDLEREDERPSSIIITTLSGLAYEKMLQTNLPLSNLYVVIKNMLNSYSNLIDYSLNEGWILKNPSNEEENFLRKWQSDYNLKDAFFEWLNQAKTDILINPEKFIESDQDELRAGIYKSFGESVGKDALFKYGEEIGMLAKNGDLRFNLSSASISNNKDDRSYKEHTYFGG